MKKDYSHIIFLLDRSGSMEGIRTDTIGGFNSFLSEQKKLSNKCTFTLVQFDDKYEENYKFTDLQQVVPLNESTYVPRNTTALYDSIGRLIDETGLQLSNMSEDERPEKIIFVILTDGFENASTKFTSKQIHEKVTLQTDTYNWQFVFLGANQDAILSASQIGIGAISTMTFTASSAGVKGTYGVMSSNITSYRDGNKSISFTTSDRSAAMGES